MGAGAKASKGPDEEEYDAEDASGHLPEGWPQPLPGDVQVLSTLELPPVLIPRHRAGDPSYYQQLALDLDVSELPDEGGWSGLARPQMGRLHHSPLALSVARQETLGGLQTDLEEPALPDGGQIWLEDETAALMAGRARTE